MPELTKNQIEKVGTPIGRDSAPLPLRLTYREAFTLLSGIQVSVRDPSWDNVPEVREALVDLGWKIQGLIEAKHPDAAPMMDEGWG